MSLLKYATLRIFSHPIESGADCCSFVSVIFVTFHNRASGFGPLMEVPPSWASTVNAIGRWSHTVFFEELKRPCHSAQTDSVKVPGAIQHNSIGDKFPAFRQLLFRELQILFLAA